MQKRTVTSGETYHRLIDRHIAMRIELHGLSDDVTGFRTVSGQKSHLIHRVKKLSVGRLETVDLRDRTGHDDTHRIGHEVALESIVNILQCRRRRRKALGLVLQGISLRYFACIFLCALSSHVFSLFLISLRPASQGTDDHRVRYVLFFRQDYRRGEAQRSPSWPARHPARP